MSSSIIFRISMNSLVGTSAGTCRFVRPSGCGDGESASGGDGVLGGVEGVEGVLPGDGDLAGDLGGVLGCCCGPGGDGDDRITSRSCLPDLLVTGDADDGCLG
jgi:hypothetical protein